MMVRIRRHRTALTRLPTRARALGEREREKRKRVGVRAIVAIPKLMLRALRTDDGFMNENG